jgi:hypothetical protein
MQNRWQWIALLTVDWQACLNVYRFPVLALNLGHLVHDLGRDIASL